MGRGHLHQRGVLEEIEVVWSNVWLGLSQNPIKEDVTGCPFKSITQHFLNALISLAIGKFRLMAEQKRGSGVKTMALESKPRQRGREVSG